VADAAAGGDGGYAARAARAEAAAQVLVEQAAAIEAALG
jgi:hypothetical protein